MVGGAVGLPFGANRFDLSANVDIFLHWAVYSVGSRAKLGLIRAAFVVLLSGV